MRRIAELLRLPRCCVLIFFSFYIFYSLSAAGLKETVDIYYTASFNGQLVGCLCEDDPVAGLVITGAALKQKAEQNSIRIDLGDRFAYQGPENENALIKQGFKHLEYDVLLIGDQDIGFLSNNLPYLLPYNLGIPDTAGLASVYQVHGLTFLGLIEESLFRLYPSRIQDSLEVRPWQETLDNLLAEVAAGQRPAFILLFHGRLQSLEDYLTQRQPRHLPLVLLAHEQRLLQDYKVAQSRIFSPGANGNLIGHLQIDSRLKIVKYGFEEYMYQPVSADSYLESLAEELLFGP